MRKWKGVREDNMSGSAIFVVAHQTSPRFLLIPQNRKHKNITGKCSFNRTSETSDVDPNISSSSSAGAAAQARLDLLDQLTSSSPQTQTYDDDKLTIRDQLALLAIDRDDDFTIPLGKNLKKFTPKFLTTSQKRNIKRQTYLNEVSKRNDSAFFATIGAFVLLPPFAILAVALATGYLQLFP